MRVLIVGCGYVGSALGAELVRQGHAVWGLCRSDRRAAILKAAGIVALTADITRPESLPSTVRGYDWVVDCVSASGGDPREYQQVYVEGIAHVLSWLSAASFEKFVYTSSTSVYGQTDGSTVDETSPTQPEAWTGKLLAESERVLLKAASEKGFRAVVLRVGGIYGPGRSYWLDQFQAGTAAVEDGGGRMLNMIHRDDVVGAVVAALLHGTPGRIYNAVDDEAVTQLAFFEWLSARLDRPFHSSRAGSGVSRKRGMTNKKVSNRRLREELGYQFKFPTFRAGYESILNS